MEWPELLQRYSDALRSYASWVENGCAGEPPAPIDPTGVRGPVPNELRAYASGLVAQTAIMQRAVSERLAGLRSTTGQAAPMRTGYEARPMPRYLDALG